MLQSLSVKNIALIDGITVELSDGFNVITGETGAGKSILVDSLELLLGDRADKALVRTGTQSAEVEGVFFVRPEVRRKVFGLLDVPTEEELAVRRTLAADGRSTVRVNGHAVTLSMLRAAMEYVADIYGQHESTALLRKENHIRLLDAYAHERLKEQLAECAELYSGYSEIKRRLSAGYGSPEERARRMDMLRFQIDEIEAAAIEEDEEAQLYKDRERLRNAERIAEGINAAHEALNGEEDGACQALSVAVKALREAAGMDESLAEFAQRLQDALYEAEDISQELDNISQYEQGEQSLEQLEERIEELKQLKRKYGAGLAEVTEYAKNARAELEELENAEDTVLRLASDMDKTRTRLYECCVRLDALRREAAAELEHTLLKELKLLGMKSAVFSVKFAPLLPKEQAVFTPEGISEAEFLFSANLGEPLKPLYRVISGGEMSRFMLALKSIMADCDNIDTMVFDEIDTGISGRMAQVTAEKMAGIAMGHQVLCVTHLPQIAAMADKHFFISKSERDGKTVTELEELDSDRRCAEIARLAGGELTKIALAHAQEMLKAAQEYKMRVGKR